MEAKLYGQNKGGMSINGIIKDYYAYAGEKISAGDLVEYINGVAGQTDYGESVDTPLSTDYYSGNGMSAVKLSENRIFISHGGGTDRRLSGMVVTIEGTNIICGIDTLLVNTANTAMKTSTVALDDSRIFIAHNRSGYLYGIVVNIDGTTITAGIDTQIETNSSTSDVMSACLLPSGNVFIAYSYSSEKYLYSIVCSISGTTITKGTSKALNSGTKYAGYEFSTCLLPNGNVFVAHDYSASHYLYGIVCTISDLTISKGTDTQLSTVERSGISNSNCLLSNGNVFIAHSYSSSYYLYGMVVSINGTAITKRTDTQLSAVASTSYSNICLLPDGNVFIAHYYGSDTKTARTLYGMVVSIDGTTITAGIDTQLNTVNNTGYVRLPLLLDNGTIFIAHSLEYNQYYLYAQIFDIDYENNVPTNHIVVPDYETQIRQVTTGQFDGIAKTSGEGGDDTGHNDLVSIWTMPQEVVYTDNLFANKTWNEETENKCISTDGYIVEVNTQLNPELYAFTDMFDGVTEGASLWYGAEAEDGLAQITCPNPVKITKMKTQISCSIGPCFVSAEILGSKDNETWYSLYTITERQMELTEILLSNSDYYLHYRIKIILQTGNNGVLGHVMVQEIQTSEYIVLE